MENTSYFDDITNKLNRIGIDTEIPIVHAIFVNDHSGSMQVKTESGQTRAMLATKNFNEQLAKIQRESDGIITTVTVIEFDDRILCNEHLMHQIRDDNDIQTTIPVDEVKQMIEWWAGGATALRDAIGAAINIGNILLSKHKTDDQSVLVMILTDGEENASKEWSDDQIREEIKTLEASDKWTFTFMGGELQATDMIVRMGFSSGNTYCMSQNIEGYSSAIKMSDGGLDRYYKMRRAGETNTRGFFTPEDDKCQQKEEGST